MVTRAEPGGHCAAWEGDPRGRGPRASVGLVLRKWDEAGTLLGSVGLRVGELSSWRSVTVSSGAAAGGLGHRVGDIPALPRLMLSTQHVSGSVVFHVKLLT